MLVYDQSKHLVPFDKKNVLFNFHLHVEDEHEDIFENDNEEQLNQRVNHHHDGCKRDFVFNKNDLIKLKNSNSPFLDFKSEDIETFKNIIKGDLEFFKENDIINYRLQMLIEKRDLIDETDLQSTSFITKNELYIYHFGLIDYSQKFGSLGFVDKKKAKMNCIKKHKKDDAETYF